jgi:hypothetical protein
LRSPSSFLMGFSQRKKNGTNCFVIEFYTYSWPTSYNARIARHSAPGDSLRSVTPI